MKYKNIICDYDICADINDIDYDYNIIIYEVDKENIQNMYITKKTVNAIYIAYSNDSMEEHFIEKLMNNGFDIYINNEMNKETIDHMLCVYTLITK